MIEFWDCNDGWVRCTLPILAQVDLRRRVREGLIKGKVHIIASLCLFGGKKLFPLRREQVWRKFEKVHKSAA